jgi:hypothetical protein
VGRDALAEEEGGNCPQCQEKLLVRRDLVRHERGKSWVHEVKMFGVRFSAAGMRALLTL